MKLASIELIHSITPHTNAEKLECAKVLEWPVVVKKGEFTENQPIIFIFPDTVCPQTPFFSFLEKKKYRVNKIKLRGQISYGIVCKISDFFPADKLINIGEDVGEALEIIKYEKPIDVTINGETKGGFPSSLISITDEDNFLSNKLCIEEFKGLECYITIKCDGSSYSLIYHNEQLRVCSRRLELKEGESAWWRVTKKYDLDNKIKSYGNIAIQGELCGPKMNGNELKLTELDLFVFNAKNLDTGEFYGLNKLQELCLALQVPMVKVISQFIWPETWGIDELREIANSVTYPAGNPGEGIVIRPIIPQWSSVLGKWLSLKVISDLYKD